MKKFFKLFAVALVAGAMFTACGEDPITPEGGDTTTPGGGDTPETPTIAEGVHFTMGESSWDAAPDFIAWYAQSADGTTTMAQIIGGKDAGLDFQTTEVVRYVGIVSAGTQEAAFDPNTNGMTNENVAVLDVFSADAEGYLSDQQGSPYGNYWAETTTITFPQFDATSMALIMKADAVMFDAYSALTGAVTMDAAERRNMTLTANVNLIPMPEM